MKKILTLVTVIVTVMTMTLGGNAWGLLAPQAAPSINAVDLIGKRLPELEQLLTNAGLYYKVEWYDSQARKTVVLEDTRPKHSPAAAGSEIEAPLGGYGEYAAVRLYIYEPDDLENYVLWNEEEVTRNYGEYVDINNLVFFDELSGYGQTITFSNSIKSPLQGIMPEMTEAEIMNAVRTYHYGYLKLTADPEWSDEYSILVSDGTWEISFNFGLLYGKVETTATAVLHYHVCGDCTNASYYSRTASKEGRDPRWYNWNTQYHWRECFCGKDIEYEAHDFVNSHCRICGALKGLNQKTHTHQVTNYEKGYNETMHFYKCAQCDSPYMDCNFDDAPQEHHFSADGSCSGCDYVNPAYSSHEHIYENYVPVYDEYEVDWSYGHSAKCLICGYENTENHNYTYRRIDDQYHERVCTVCGLVEKYEHKYDDSLQCDCGQTVPEHVCNTDAYGSTWITGEMIPYHYKKCSICGKKQLNYEMCTLTWYKGENTHYAVCDVCGIKYAEGQHTMYNERCLWCGYSTLPFLPGDLNSSGGDPDVLDGVVMQRILASLEPEITAADLNRDGIVNVADGVVMQRILAGLE